MKEARDLIKEATPFKVAATVSACLFSFLCKSLLFVFFARCLLPCFIFHADGHFRCLHGTLLCQSTASV